MRLSQGIEVVLRVGVAGMGAELHGQRTVTVGVDLCIQLGKKVIAGREWQHLLN